MIAPVAKLIDKIIPDPQARDRAKLELLKLQGDQEMAAIGQQMQAIIAEANSADPWTSRARPSFLYAIYVLILWAIPMGLIAAVNPTMADAIGRGMTAYLRGTPKNSTPCSAPATLATRRPAPGARSRARNARTGRRRNERARSSFYPHKGEVRGPVRFGTELLAGGAGRQGGGDH